MRITLTLDDDVAAALERLRKTRNQSLKTLVNDVLRRGLREIDRKPQQTRFRTRSANLGRVKARSFDNVAEAVAVIKGDAFK